ncbi:MAG: hypothetical protein ABI726_05300, partial [bacterium]
VLREGAARWLMVMARREAVRDAKRRPGADASGARAKALLASRDEFWARSVEHLCGPQLVDRTVVVLLHFPVPEEKYGSASLSQGRVFVARFGPHRYRVWWVHH